MRKVILLLSLILVGCGAVTPTAPVANDSARFSFLSPNIARTDAAEREGLDLVVGIFGVSKDIVFLYGGMAAYDGEYLSMQSTLLRSTNGGTSWEEVMKPVSNSSIKEFSMRESGRGWALMYSSAPPSHSYTLYQTNDYGENWQETASIPLSSTEFPIVLQMIWIDELHGQIDILYNNSFGYIEFLTTNDGGQHWIQSGKYKPKFEGNVSTLIVLDSYRSLIKDESESFSLDHSGFWNLDGRYGDPDAKIIKIRHEIYTDDGSLNVQEIVLPKHFEFIDGQIK